MKRKCNVCGQEVEIPKEVKEGDSRIIKCPFCGAMAPLWVKKRNNKVKGLKNCFLSRIFFGEKNSKD